MHVMGSDGHIGPRGNGLLRVHEAFGYLDQMKRWEILALLCKRPMSISEIARFLDYEISDMCRQVRILQRCGLVIARRVKKEQRQRISSKAAVRLRGNRLRVRLSSPVNGAVHALLDLDESLMRRLDRVDAVSCSNGHQA